MNKRFYFGLIIFFASFLQFIIGEAYISSISLTIFWTLSFLGCSLVSDGITYKIYGKSLITKVFGSKHNVLHFIATSIAAGFILDLIAKWAAKLWVYPYLTFETYVPLTIIFYAAYWLAIANSYLAGKAIFDYLIKGVHKPTRYYKYEDTLYKFLGGFGTALILGGIALIIKSYLDFGELIFSLSEPINFKLNFLYVLLIFFGGWFVLEFIEYMKKKSSLLKDIIHHEYSPILSIIVVSILVAAVVELQNLPYGFWRYTNWPWESIQIIGVPVVVFLVWPLHYIAFLSLFRAFTDKESNEVWQADLIE